MKGKTGKSANQKLRSLSCGRACRIFWCFGVFSLSQSLFAAQVAHWPLDEMTGLVAADSINGNHADLVSFPVIEFHVEDSGHNYFQIKDFRQDDRR